MGNRESSSDHLLGQTTTVLHRTLIPIFIHEEMDPLSLKEEKKKSSPNLFALL